MKMVDEVFEEDHFIEISLDDLDLAILQKRGAVKRKTLVNGEIVSLAVVLEDFLNYD